MKSVARVGDGDHEVRTGKSSKKVHNSFHPCFQEKTKVNPILFLIEMAEVIPPIRLPYRARESLCPAQSGDTATELRQTDKVNRDSLSLKEDFAVSATVSLYLDKAYPAWLWCDDCLIRVTRLSTESGEVWLLLTRSDEAIGRFGPMLGKGGVE